MNFKVFLDHAATMLREVSETPRLDAEIMLGHVCGMSRAKLYAYPEKVIEVEALARLDALMQRRVQGEPMAYLLGEQAFYDLELRVNRHTLIPRPETECLVEAALAEFDSKPRRVLDLGTGSGAIALALARHRPDWRIDAVDKSEPALEVARMNATLHQLHQVNFILSDWFNAIVEKPVYQLIVSNPPYVEDNYSKLPLLKYEPIEALVAKDKGMSCLHHIAANAKQYLMPGGALMLEHGESQQKLLADFLQQNGYHSIRLFKDYSEKPRFVLAYYA